MSAPLLEVAGLTVQFGGLKAVDGVDLRVQPGEVVAVIGPNGAGKTTVFNAISGIYAPSAGNVTFAGAPLLRPLSWRHMVGFAFLGLVLGTALMLADANVDRMWAVSIKQNFRGGSAPFPVGAAARSAVDYMAELPHIEERLGRYFVVSWDGKTHHGTARTLGEAEDLLRRARAGVDAAQGVEPLVRRIIVFLLGLSGGSLASFAVWQQSRRTTAWIARRGMARTFQNNRLFHNMSVIENVLVALDRHVGIAPVSALVYPATMGLGLAAFVAAWRWQLVGEGVLAAGLFVLLAAAVVFGARMMQLGAFTSALRRGEARLSEEARTLLAFVGLANKADEVSRNLAYGDQRRLEIARALATRPQLLMLDEPAAGMNPTETRNLLQLIRDISARGIAVLLIEHDMKLVMEISDRIAVLEYGRKIADGTPAAVRANPAVIAAYLGQEGAE